MKSIGIFRNNSYQFNKTKQYKLSNGLEIVVTEGVFDISTK
jgi:hypothetical protein